MNPSIERGEGASGTEEEIAEGKRLLVGVKMAQHFAAIACKIYLSLEVAEDVRRFL